MTSSPARKASGPLFGLGAMWAGQVGPVPVSYSLQAYSCESPESTQGFVIRVFGHLKPDEDFVEPFEQQMLSPALRPVLRLQDGRTACLRLVWDGRGVLVTGHLQENGKEAIDIDALLHCPERRVTQQLDEWVMLSQSKVLAARGKVFEARDKILTLLKSDNSVPQH